MMKAKDILDNARYTLSDLAKDRWTDARLLALLNEGLTLINTKTTIFVETKIIVLTDLVADLDLSASATKIVRAEYLDEKVPLKTMDEMDSEQGKAWMTKKGPKLEAIVYSKQKRGLYRLYPVPENAQNSNISYSSPYGIITEISYSDIQPVMFDLYGDIEGIPDDALLKIFLVRKHSNITDVNEELNIDDIVTQPLTHFIAGRAFRDNQDTQHRALADEELKFFYSLINEFSIEKAENFARTNRATAYLPMG